VCSIKQAGLREKDRAKVRGKQVASALARQHTSWALKSLRKRVRFAKPFHPPSKRNQFTGNYKDFIRGLQVDRGFTNSLQIRRGFTGFTGFTGKGFTGFTGLRRPIRTYKEL